MYQVVVFIETNEVEAIPANWLKSNYKAYWPDSYSFLALQRAIECNAQPDPTVIGKFMQCVCLKMVDLVGHFFILLGLYIS